MYQSLANQSWAVSGATVTTAANTDCSLSGSSRKISWTNGENATATLSFTSVTLSDWEELTMQLWLSPRLTWEDGILRITVDGEDLDIARPKGAPGWTHVLINCRSMGAVTSIVFKSLIPDLVVFVDVAGVRKQSNATMHRDVTDALENAISLSYGVSTTLSAAAAVGAQSISLTSSQYVFNTSQLRLTNGGTTEVVQLMTRSGKLKTALTNAFPSGATVTVLCPTVREDADGIEPDPVVGVNLIDLATGEPGLVAVDTVAGSVLKKFLSAIVVQVYIDCTSKDKVLELSAEFQNSFGREFRLQLDGEFFDVYLESEEFIDRTEAGNNPRKSWMYRIDPQPATFEVYIPMTSTITMNPENIPA